MLEHDSQISALLKQLEDLREDASNCGTFIASVEDAQSGGETAGTTVNEPLRVTHNNSNAELQSKQQVSAEPERLVTPRCPSLAPPSRTPSNRSTTTIAKARSPVSFSNPRTSSFSSPNSTALSEERMRSKIEPIPSAPNGILVTQDFSKKSDYPCFVQFPIKACSSSTECKFGYSHNSAKFDRFTFHVINLWGIQRWTDDVAWVKEHEEAAIEQFRIGKIRKGGEKKRTEVCVQLLPIGRAKFLP